MTRQPPRSPDEVESLLARYDLGRNVSLAARFPPDQYPHTRRCAILVPLYFSTRDRQLHVLLTLRARHMRTHASHVSFPGGARDPDDVDDTATALREAQEEVGLSPGDVRVVARLPPTFIFKNNAVFPVVGFIPETFTPNPNPDEVALAFSVPLRDFVEKPLTLNQFRFGSGAVVQSPSLTHVHPDGHRLRVWGATCTLCVLVARAVFGVAEPWDVLGVVEDGRGSGAGSRNRPDWEEGRVGGDRRAVTGDGDEDGGAADLSEEGSQFQNESDAAAACVEDDDGNLFKPLEVYYHFCCRATRPWSTSRL